jgi:hypothetical protein
MLDFRKTLARLTILCCSTASLYGGPTTRLPAQEADFCSNINYVGVGCGMFRFVGVERAKPFIAQRIVTSVGHNLDGASNTVNWIEIIARDSQGRIRFEQRSPFKPPNWRDGAPLSNHEIEKIVIPGDASGPLVTIFDCLNRRSIVLQPEQQAAHVMQTCASLPPDQNSSKPYSYPITLLLGAKLPPDVLVEDLGNKEIEGIIAHGVKSTALGTEKDGEWDGKPLRIIEKWMSDELGVTVLYIQSDLRAHSETTSRFTNIRRTEPDASLFEIPANYKITLTQETVESGLKQKPL